MTDRKISLHNRSARQACWISFLQSSINSQSAIATHENFDQDAPATRLSERSFGIVFSVVFALVGLYPLLGDSPPQWWSLAIAAVFLGLALVTPRALRPTYRLWMKSGERPR